MAVKPTLPTLTTGNVDPTVLNSALDILAEGIADCWDKSGTDSVNNTITGDLDMNGFSIKNIGDPDEDADSLATRGWVETNYGTGATAEAEHWANYPEDQLVPEGDLVDDYSALHWAAKAAASATAAQLAETNAETAETNAEAAQVAAEAAQAAAEAAVVAASGFDATLYMVKGAQTVVGWSRTGTTATITMTNINSYLPGGSIIVGDYLVIVQSGNTALEGLHVVTAVNAPTSIEVTTVDSGSTSGTCKIYFVVGSVNGISNIVGTGATTATCTFTSPMSTNRYIVLGTGGGGSAKTTTTFAVGFATGYNAMDIGVKE